MRKIALVAVTTVALLAPTAAFGKTVRQTGFVKGDMAATVKLRVKLHGKDPVKVGGFKAKNVKANCDKGPIRISLTALTPVKVSSDHDFKVRLGDGNGGVLRISGTVKGGGKRTVGNLKTNEFKSGKQSCRVPKQRFSTSS